MGETEKRHQWVGAAEVVIPSVNAAKAAARQRFVVPATVVVTIQEVYCRRCRRGYTTERAKSPCQLGPQHVGGPRRRDDDDRERQEA